MRRLDVVHTNETIDFLRAEDVSGQKGYFNVNNYQAKRIELFFGSRQGKGFNFTLELYHDSISDRPKNNSNNNNGTAASKGALTIWIVWIIFKSIRFEKKLKNSTVYFSLSNNF